LTSLGKIYTRELNIPGRNWTDGFPGVTDRFEWFGLEYKATIRANEKGRYTFKLLSDDGSRLYVDDSLLIDNDGLHGQVEKSGTIDLDKNTHQITVQYFQGPRFMIALQLFVKKENGEQVIFPGKEFALTTPASKRLVPNIYLWLLVLLFIVVVIIFLRRRRKNEEKQLTSGQAG
jgi:hypothetical protein